MKLSSVSRVVSVRGLGALGVALTLGLVAGCGDDEGAESPAPSGGDAAVTSTGDAAAVETTGEEAGETSEGENPENTSDGPGDGDDAGGGGGNEPGLDAGNQSSSCGGVGEPCCEEAACNRGLVCVGASPEQPNIGGDAGAGFGFEDIIAILGDAGLLASDGGIGLPGFDAGGLIAPPPAAAGVCESGPNDAGPAESHDAGDAGGEDCGGAGQVCCRESFDEEPYCNDGFECDNPGGAGLNDSSCVAPAGNDGADAAVECGGAEQPCCGGRGGRGMCDDGLDCDSRAPRGLEGDVCVED
jgi:hypothetical protein